MIETQKKDVELRMQKSIHALEEELAKLRAGRAHPSLLDNIVVSYYGNDTALSSVASIGVEGALMLTVKPWEKQLVQPIEKAIRISGLGLNPAVSGDVIRVPLPPLSEERRKELIKRVKTEGESAKVAIRNIRRDANNHLKDLLKDKKVTEDEVKRAEDVIQKMTDKYVHEVDQALMRKEKDLMVI